MEPYKNLGGDSGVSAFEIGNDSIKVQFSDLSVYLYNYEVTGTQNVEQMKALAHGGEGLNSFINRRVRKTYAAKLK